MVNTVYMNANEPIEARVRDLLSRMTLKEKLGQMTQIEHAVATPEVIRDLCIGSVLSRGDKTTSADMIDGFQKGALELRLGIPILYDSTDGIVNAYGTTIFPCCSVLAAAGMVDWDLLTRIADACATAVSSIVTRCVGIRIKDWEALDQFYDPHGSNYTSAVSSAINEGVDMVTVPLRYQLFLEDLAYLVESGEVSMARIDDAVEHILRAKFAAGLFEHLMADRSSLDKLAREAVRKSLVLLKNGKDPRKPFLPLNRNVKKVLVTGKHADDLAFQCGGSTATTEIANLGSADDNSELKILFKGDELLKLVAQEIPTLAILISGRPLVLEPSLLETLVAAWLPGTEGNGITDVIFGDYESGGRLLASWPKDSHQNIHDPLFPDGYRLKSKL
ncbi:hypothetical protein L1987_04148 [Smallanthus sonchifolius]|uniref:Uncharacterized protein n=1 Tax=Smallanthus sonchifolius TaxID=185202 RepID=A0ACB9KCJ7_9ASTR|nr:hypothetical protein L1987_04148 [Smallanthus sonchifolius]